MASLSSYFIKSNDSLKARNDCIIFGSKYRFTVLTERLIRLEYNENGIFEDRASELAVFRKFERPAFTYSKKNGLIEIKTSYFTLNYLENKPFKGSKLAPGNTLNIKLNNSDRVWYYNQPEARNLGGTKISLDDLDNKLEKGLFSLDGFASLDDSNSMIIDNDQFIPRDNKSIDIYIFMYRKDFGLCLKDYFALTGSPSLIPRYVFGNWWYKNEKYSFEDVKNIIENFKYNDIPLSVLMLGENCNSLDNNFMLDQSLFPNSQELITYMHNLNIKLGMSIQPNTPISSSNSKYQTMSSSLNINNKDIEFLPFNKVKLGMYFKLFINDLIKSGIDLFYINYNNINDLYSLWLLNHYHYAIANTESKRGMILSRNALVAAHRYPVLYSGKTKVSWDTLNFLPYYNSSASNIGISFWAHAIGGFYGGIEDTELYMRYIQFGVYSPILILASDKGKYYKREPWMYDMGHLKIISEYMNLRNKLIPYIYSESYNYYLNGLPLIQALYYKYPNIFDEQTYRNEYFFGKEFFIAPITKKKDLIMNRVIQKLFVPEGIWYDFKTGKKFPGGNYYVSFYKDEDYPVFCQAGAIIPLSNNHQSTQVPTDMEIHIFPGKSNSYNLYEDDGVTNLYKEGYYLKTLIDYNYLSNNYTVIIRPIEGKTGIIPNNRNYKIRFRNTKEAEEVIIFINDKKEENIKTHIDENDFIIEINNVPTNSQLTINCKGKDIEIDAVRLINEEISSILMDLEIETKLKYLIDEILFSNLSIKKKRIEIRKLKHKGLENKFIKMFIKLLEYINEI